MRSRENKAHSGGAIRFSLRHSDAAYVRVHQVTDQTTGYSQDVPRLYHSAASTGVCGTNRSSEHALKLVLVRVFTTPACVSRSTAGDRIIPQLPLLAAEV